ncbi:MAG: SH3 domain-containing protein [Chloroflexales bacterium]|nr:SH3 domain-containing protein [Chloroflexales bacterium]
MPAKINPRDWDRLFRKNAPRRGGPLQALVNILIVILVLGLLGSGVFFGARYANEQARINQATQVVQATTAAAQRNATREARTATAAAETSTAASAPAPPADLLGTSQIVQAGNLRREPLIQPDTVIGQVCIGDEVALLEERTVASILWYRISVTNVAEDCDPSRVATGTEGWASSQLIAALSTPVPTP